jgi:hypothetical protein
MKNSGLVFRAILLGGLLFGTTVRGDGDNRFAAVLPEGVKAVWDFDKAYREATPTRERVCLNGLWRWQPARVGDDNKPTNQWGYFKVPACWPGITDYLQKDSQRVYVHPSWEEEKLGGVTAVWYERTMSIPDAWAGRRLALQVEYLNSYAAIYVDGAKAGEIRFPGGEVDLTHLCRPGEHMLSVFVAALPLKEVMVSHSDTAAAKEVKATVTRRGLCGDVWLVSSPAQARLDAMKVETSVRQWTITFGSALAGLSPEAQYALRARITRGGREVATFKSRSFKASDVRDGRMGFTQKWRPDRLWDLNSPENTYQVQLSLLDSSGNVLDTAWPERFGFREFWIEGRDFFLNGSRIWLSAVPLDNAEIGAATATYEAVRESLARLKSFGINFVYTHNYGCEPGTHLSFAEALRAADDAGVLVALSQPHFSQYDWQAADADQNNGYARHAAFYTCVAGNHPSVVFYSMSHNATGYEEDMNPDLMDGRTEPRDQWSQRNARLALRAQAIVEGLDPSRIVYHHSSGNLGTMHTVNFYANFAPIQEQSEWFGHWATDGVKPLFTCEYSVPFTWDWTMYRGWYRGNREWGSARVPWEFCLAEWNAQFLGDRAFRGSEMEYADLRWEAKQFRDGKVWHRWDYPYEVGSKVFADRYEVMAMYLEDNWRAFRTWGVSATSPWEHEHYWKLRDGVSKARQEFKVDWDSLQRPGYSPDYLDQRYERMDLAFERSDWIETPAARALLRNNQTLLAWLAGKPAAFTSKDHNFQPGAEFEKQLILINNSRSTVACKCDWSLEVPRAVRGSKSLTLPTGEQARIPLRFKLPPDLAPGSYQLRAAVRFSTGETQKDSFVINILPRPAIPPSSSKVALFDPKGETGAWLAGQGIPHVRIEANADLSPYDTLIVGKAALTPEGVAPDISRVREGLKVIVFEQSANVLEQRFGFRVAEYGLRWVFKRVPDHPILAGLGPEHLRDWRGEATLAPPRLNYELRSRYGPTVRWCNLPVTRLWRCGNRGNVASVLIEKPARGDFLPVLDGGYSLQYSPLLEYREGQGMVLFCQMDVTGRTETDPAAEILARNILRYVSDWKPAPTREVDYTGEAAGRRFLESAGFVPGSNGVRQASNRVIVIGPPGEERKEGNAVAISDCLNSGGSVLALGLKEQDARVWLASSVSMKKAEHISAFFEPFGLRSPFAGIGPADVHVREPRELPLVTGGATVLGDGVLAAEENPKVVFCQLVPWQFDYTNSYNLKRTYRRTAYLITRLLSNLGASGSTPLLSRFSSPVTASKHEQRWQEGFYLDQPEEWDDPYRFFRW